MCYVFTMYYMYVLLCIENIILCKKKKNNNNNLGKKSPLNYWKIYETYLWQVILINLK